MIVAIIVISVVLAAGLLTFFIGRAVRKANLPEKPKKPNIPKSKGIISWLKNHIPTKRRLIQVYAALLYNANLKGFVSGEIYQSESTKYMCVPGLNCYSCPGAVGACPMGAFQNALAESNTRAPYYILGILALFGLMLARTICGFLCPIGLCQELLYKIRTPKLKKSRVTRILSYFKYVILALAIAIPLIYAVSNIPLPAFCKYICPAGTFGGAIMLLINPNNAGLFGQLGWQFTWKFSLLIVLIIASIFIFRAFCRFICPLGAIYGFFNKFALIGVTVDKQNCTDCGLCVAHCKMDVKHVGDHECINCGECISVCPTKAISWKGSQIFLRHSAIGEPALAEKPLDISEGEVKIAATVQNDTVAETITETPPVDSTVKDTPVSMGAQATAEVAASNATEQTAEVAATETAKSPAAVKNKKPLTFWLEIAAWSVALVVLIVALICYNFVDTDKPYSPPKPSGTQTGCNVGDIAPDFTLNMYNAEGTYTLYDQRGKVTIIVFWDAGNALCVQKIPYYNELAGSSADISVVAINGSTEQDVQSFIDEQGWGEYTITFAQDVLDEDETGDQTLQAYGGSDTMPLMVVVDETGKIVYNGTQTFENAQQLETFTARLTAKKGYAVNETAPDFTLNMYNTDGKFNLYAQHGKLTVVNFWATWCTPCVEELPYFNELAENYSEIEVVAIHGSSTRDVQSFIDSKGWSDYALTFVQDDLDGTVCKTFRAFGGTSMWPMTVIIDADGKVVYNSTLSFRNYEQLETLVSGFLQEE